MRTVTKYVASDGSEHDDASSAKQFERELDRRCLIALDRKQIDALINPVSPMDRERQSAFLSVAAEIQAGRRARGEVKPRARKENQ